MSLENKENCPCRNQENSEAESLWKMMNDENGFQPGDAVVRVKTDMTLPNPALRDWPALRIQTNAHPVWAINGVFGHYWIFNLRLRITYKA